MLVVKNITKTYRPKKGVPVTALDDVSLSFGDKGLVFILGKSGSGKSTLLNLVGGLDRADSGEFIIEGKSSKLFKASDFDSYRNTFIGFIFQEYNILNEFNVKSNIALAMELQGRKATDKTIDAILKEVDLDGFGGRKPAELSGGQKQRVAIARALVKEPKIIMADEPTGALDSNTGRQVFDTLKKLSAQKLVLVVSHDREFAEYYGDRVIELADGKVVSDILKYHAVAERASDGVSIVDGDILRIEPDYLLTETDLALINDYLKARSGETIISSDKRANEGLKRAAMIDENGAKESFCETAQASDADLGIKPVAGEATKFVKSHMPYKKAFKMGVSGLKNKKIRLFFTILLSFIALSMFGVADTLAAYNKVDNTVRSLVDNGISSATFYRNNYDELKFLTNTDVDALSAETGVDFQGVMMPLQKYSYNTEKVELPNLYKKSTQNQNESYYNSFFSGFYDMDEASLKLHGASLFAGRLPESGNEIAISKYLFECYKMFGLTDANRNLIVKQDRLTADESATGIFGKQLTFYSNEYDFYSAMLGTYTVVGIVDTKISQKFDDLKKIDAAGNFTGDIQDYMRLMEFTKTVDSGLHSLFLVRPGFVAEKTTEINACLTGHVGYFLKKSLSFEYATINGNYSADVEHILKLGDADADAIAWLDGAPLRQLESEQSLISLDMASRMIYNSVAYRSFHGSLPCFNDQGKESQIRFDTFDGLQNALRIASARNEIIANGVPSDFIANYRDSILQVIQENSWENTAENRTFAARAVYTKYLTSNIYAESGQTVNPYGTTGDALFAKTLIEYLHDVDLLDEVLPKLTFDPVEIYDNAEGQWIRKYRKTTIVGIYAGDLEFMMNSGRNNSVVLSDDLYKSYAVERGFFTRALAPMPQSGAEVKKLVQLHYRNVENDEGLRMINSVVASFDSINSIIESMARIFMYVGIGLAIFSAFLLANFIAVSVANKKREIGILRAVGAKSSDVYSIFFSESLVIAAINFVLALIGTIVVSIVLNRVFAEEIGISISLLNFGIRQIALMLAISLAVAAAATFLPVYFIAKKRPIEAIRG